MKERLKKLVELLQTKSDGVYEITLSEVEKLDGKKTSVTVKSAKHGIALNYYVEHKIRDGETLEHIADWIMLTAAQELKARGDKVNEITKLLSNFESAKPYLTACVCLQKCHESFLKDKAWYGYLDLAVYFRVIIEGDAGDRMEYAVTNEVMKLWNVTIEEMKKVADENSPVEQVKVLQMNCPADCDNAQDFFVPSVMAFTEAEKKGFPTADKALIGLTFSSPKLDYGGSLITRTDILERISKNTGMDLLVLPSSRDDIIVVALEKVEKDFFENQCESVKFVNEQQFADYEEEMILSDHAYIFSKEKKRILEKWELDAYFSH